MPDEDKPLPEDIEIEISRLSAEAAGKLLRKDQAEIAQKKAQQQQQDPLTQIQQRELALKEAEFEHKKQLDVAKLQADVQAKEANIDLQEDRLKSEERREGARLEKSTKKVEEKEAWRDG